MREFGVLVCVRVQEIESRPFHEVRGLNAAGRGLIERVALPALAGRVAGLPDALDALLIASDLQALERPDRASGPQRLVGEAVAEQLAGFAPARTGVLLAGDLFTVADLGKRGGLGDVRSVWSAFEERFAWVAGVRGNHDELAFHPGLLDGTSIERSGLTIGGVSGIVGNPRKPNRRTEAEFIERIELLLAEPLDVLVLHEGPETANGEGNASVRELLLAHERELLVVCGHSHWARPLADLSEHVQVLNADARALLLLADR